MTDVWLASLSCVDGDELLDADALMSADGKQRFGLNLQDAVNMWPTPTCRDHKGARLPETILKTGRNPLTNSLADATATTNPAEAGKLAGSLNPEWVEWLMGYPPGWTDLKD